MNELQLKTGVYRATLTGLEVLGESTPEQWRNYFKLLIQVGEAQQWLIGDMLVDGKKHYGDGLYKQAAEITGYDANKLRQYKSISERFEMLLRSNKLSWNHHYEVASIKLIDKKKDGKLFLSDDADKEKIAEFLEKAELNGWSVVELRKQVRTYKEWQRQHIAAANEPEKYAVIYADPPWQYTSGDQHCERPQDTVLSDHYPSMHLNDICRLPQAKLSATDCILFLWCTSPTLEEALTVIKAWGFKYKAQMVWDKVAHNVGNYVSVRHEILLIAKKGQPPKVPKLVDSVYTEERTEHSKKPEYFRNLIDELYPNGKRIEFFCRGSAKDGWDVFGDEAIK
jgi:N6-adenosine-specific RNA methylase IME4